MSRQSMDMAQFILDGMELIQKKVSYSGNSGCVYVHPKWIGREVAIVVLDDTDDVVNADVVDAVIKVASGIAISKGVEKLLEMLREGDDCGHR